MSTNAGFQLFPNPNTTVSPQRKRRSSANHSRKNSARRNAMNTQSPVSPLSSAVERAQSFDFPSPGGRDTPQNYDMAGRFSPQNAGYGHESNGQQSHQYSQFMAPPTQRSQTPTAHPTRNVSNSSQHYPQNQFRPQTPLAQTRNVSNASQHYTQSQGPVRPQTPLAQINTSSSPAPSPPRQIHEEVQPIRSIFPTYNPNVRLEHQDYYPTVDRNDERIREVPRAVLSKRPYSPSISAQDIPTLPALKNQLQRNPSLAGTVRGGSQGPSRSTYGSPISNPRSPPLQNPASFQRSSSRQASNHSPAMEKASTTEELKELWKVTNGWRASPSEGRTFVLQMTSDPEEPIHTLSSSTDPFYTLRIEPTSTSAHLTMLRYDPSKAVSQTSKIKNGLGLTSKSTSPTPGAAPPAVSSKRIVKKKEETIEVMTTTLEETARRLPPNDGLIALLYPTAASSLVITHHLTHPSVPDHHIRETAERECARLIYDNDSGHYYLCHPCLSQPFIIRIIKSPAWSKIEYILEHPELPNDLARLVKGPGAGWVVVDSGTAGGLEAVYIVDVAITALCVVAVTEEKLGNGITQAKEIFEGPPTPTPNENIAEEKGKSARFSIFGPKKAKRDSKGMQEFEIDLESNDSSLKSPGKRDKGKEDKGPFLIRVCLFGVRCAVWLVGAVFGCLLTVLIGLGGCLARRVK